MKNYKFTIHGTQYEVEINSVEDQTINLNLNGTPYEVKVDKEIKQTKTPKLMRSVAVPSTEGDATNARTNAAGATAEIKSPLPGTVLDVMVKEGDTVKVGQHLLLLEAMKMENNIDSDKEGVVKTIKVRKGDAVMEGDVLIVME